MNKNLKPINSIYVMHCAREGVRFLSQFKDRKVKISPKISVVSVSNYDTEPLLHYQMRINNIKVLNDSVGFKENSDKIDCICRMLRTVKTEYTLIADSYDTIIMKDLDDSFIRRFNLYDKGIMISEDKCRYPNCNVHDMEIENNWYINSGCMFGKTRELLDFYTKLSNFKRIHYSGEKEEYRKSDQYWIRYYIASSGFKNYRIDISKEMTTTYRNPMLDENDNMVYFDKIKYIDRKR